MNLRLISIILLLLYFGYFRIADVVINEVELSPLEGDLQWVELYKYRR